MEQNQEPITKLLKEIKSGDKDALAKLLPVVYDELRILANSQFKSERSNHTLQPTALVHEAYLRLIRQKEIEWENRAHFFGIAARLMREILIEYARSYYRQKRGGKEKTQIVLDADLSFGNDRQLDILAVDEALTKLEQLDERQARVVEMKFFGGLKIEEIAEVMDISPATVKRDWSSAKLLLSKMLNIE